MLWLHNPDIETTGPTITPWNKDLGWMHDHTNGPFYGFYSSYSFLGISEKQTLQFIHPTTLADQVTDQQRGTPLRWWRQWPMKKCTHKCRGDRLASYFGALQYSEIAFYFLCLFTIPSLITQQVLSFEGKFKISQSHAEPSIHIFTSGRLQVFRLALVITVFRLWHVFFSVLYLSPMLLTWRKTRKLETKGIILHYFLSTHLKKRYLNIFG
jgi:hypothetical protein